jgi:hypothetical protein
MITNHGMVAVRSPIVAPHMAKTSWVIVILGEAEGSGVKSAHLRAPGREASLHADIALDISLLPLYVHVE